MNYVTALQAGRLIALAFGLFFAGLLLVVALNALGVVSRSIIAGLNLTGRNGETWLLATMSAGGFLVFGLISAIKRFLRV